MKYKTNKATQVLNKRPPDGGDMGMLPKGAEITSTDDQVINGWLHFVNANGQNRYVKRVDVDPLVPPPPPVEPPIDRELMRISFSHDGGLTYPPEEDKH